MFRNHSAARGRRFSLPTYDNERKPLRPITVIRLLVIAALSLPILVQLALAENDMAIIDDRNSGSYLATTGDEWRLITDGVMGGISNGQLTVDTVQNQDCLRLQGDVKLENNGGFIQASLDLSTDTIDNIDDYSGLALTVIGNGKQYNVHFRTKDNWVPWQSYRASFTAPPEWKNIFIPFTNLEPYRTGAAFAPHRLKSIGVVAIGREFSADICIGNLNFYM